MKMGFTIKLVLAAIFLAAAALLLQSVLHKTIPTIVWFLIPAYGLVTALLFYLIKAGAARSPHRFVASVNGSVLIKIMLTAAIVGIYLFLGLPYKKAFALSVMGIYFVYTGVLIWALVPMLRGKK